MSALPRADHAPAGGSGMPDTPAGVLAFARDQRAAADRAEVLILEAAITWAGIHATTDPAMAAGFTAPGVDTVAPIAGVGAPMMVDLAECEFAAVLGLRSDAGKRLIGEAVELRFRLPKQWAQVQAGRLPAWKARRIAARTVDLCPEGAAYVDHHLGLFAHRVSLVKLDCLVDEARARFNPAEAEQVAEQAAERRHVTIEDYQVSFDGTIQITAELDLIDAMALQKAVTEGAQALKDAGSTDGIDARRAQALGNLARSGAVVEESERQRGRLEATLYVHLSQAALTSPSPGEADFARVECPDRLLLASQVAAWCGRTDAKITVKPVIDLNASISTTAYEVSDRLREQITLRDGTCTFP